MVGVESELGRAGAIDRCQECRGIDLLLQMRVGDAGDGCNTPLQLLGDAEVGDPIVANGAHVDLCRQPEVEDLGDDVRRLKIECDFRERGWKHLA